MPFWLTWFFIGALFTGGAAALHNNSATTTADTDSTPQYTQNFHDSERAQ